MTKYLYSTPVAGHNYAQAQILYFDDGSMALQSYSTIVATVNADGWVHVNGLYSRTTIKHLGWFAKTIGTSYQILKSLLMDGKDMNIHTGEVIDWA